MLYQLSVKPDALFMVPTSLTGVSAPQREASMGMKTVLAKESFWRLIFECHLDLLVQGERDYLWVGALGLGCQWVLLL